MGWIGTAGSLGRIVFPAFSGYLGHNISFIISATSSLLCGLGVLAYKHRINKINKKIEVMLQEQELS